MRTADTRVHTLTLPWVEHATRHFVHADEMRQAFSLAVAGGFNLIFSGPGGHGKSEFLEAAMAAISDTEPYVKSFGSGTSPEELYGGLDIDALNRQGGEEKAVIQYNPELSFLPYRLALFEELFDAPARVLTGLKDTLTARELRNGRQRFSMMTRVIAAATNHSPQEIAEGGPEIAALIERFPIQLEVKWSSYTEGDFVELFDAVEGDTSHFERVAWDDVAALQEQSRNVTFGKWMRRVLSRIIVELRRDNVVISPRTAVQAMQLVKAAAAINGRDRATARDITAIAFLPGAHSLKSRISDLVEECISSMAGEEELERCEEVFEEACSITTVTERDFVGLIQILDEILNKVIHLKLSTNQTDRRQALRQKIYDLRDEKQKSLNMFELERAREAARKTLDGYRRAVVDCSEDIRFGVDHERADARRRLRVITSELVAMKLHPDLEERREELLTKIKLSGVN